MFILGAGASKPAGCPVMSEFLEKARRLALASPVGSPLRDNYEVVYDIQSVLTRALAQSSFDIDNIESIMCAIELGISLGGFGGLSRENLEDAQKALLYVIADTLDRTLGISPNRHEHDGKVHIAGTISAYQSLSHYARELARSPGHSAAIITFNYDLGIDLQLGMHSVGVDYGLDEVLVMPVGSGNPVTLPVFKLHGSLSWVRHEGKILAYSPYQYLCEDFAQERATASYFFDSSRGRRQLCGLSEGVAAPPFVVPPGEAKASYRDAILPVWKRAHEALSKADVIYVCGYSFPPTDMFFRQFYALGRISERPPRRVVLMNPDVDSTRRLEALQGPLVKGRSGVLITSNSKEIDSYWLSERKLFDERDRYL